MKPYALGLAFLLAATLSNLGAQTGAAPTAEPVNPKATPEARELLHYIDSISGHYTLTGQHNYPNTVSRWTDRIYDLTGKYPALFGQDFGFSGMDDKDSVEGRPSMIQEAKRQYQKGAIVTLTWHAVRPTDDEPVTFHDSVQGHLTDFEWSELLTPGTDLNNRWQAQVDVIAGYLRQLGDAGVPVLLRPYHEMNGKWFWWGGRPGKNGSAELYRQFFDRLVNVHHLNNLIWVWNVNSPGGNAGPIADYFPGSEYADILSIDNYGEFKRDYYDQMLALAGDKPIALGEVGGLPSLDVLAKQPRWAYFMDWSELSEALNTPDKLQTIYHAPNLLNRDDSDFTKSMSAIRSNSNRRKRVVEPVSSNPSDEATALLARLYDVSGKATLSGQQNDSHTPSNSSDSIFEVTGKYPVIYGADLGIFKEAGVAEASARQAIVDEAKRQHAQRGIVHLSWLAALPMDEGASISEQSIHDQLSDFEWKELLTPGTRLNQLWSKQVDAVAAYLKQLQNAGIPVLWAPYPESNTKKYWWAGRKGIEGSSALYRMLFERLVEHDGVHNLIWVWEARPAGSGPNAGGRYNDYFPGLLYVDALSLNLDPQSNLYRPDSALKLIGSGKIIGLSLERAIPDPALFAQQPDWTWFILAPISEKPIEADQPQKVRKLYDDPRTVSLIH